MEQKVGQEMYALLEKLFPLNRSLTGKGVRETFQILQSSIPLNMHQIASGSDVFDWTVPKEWEITEAYIESSSGKRLIDFADNNLHVMGYSTPVDKTMPLAELQEHLYSLQDQPTAIPYITSYYKERWGFCMTHEDRVKLAEDDYHVVIKSSLTDGVLNYADLLIPGESENEILISSYVCHPSMANNELSGPVVVTELVKWLQSKPRKYSYRIVLVPETIGSLVYLSKHLETLKTKMVAGLIVSCVGDDGAYSYIASRYENTLADKVVMNILKQYQNQARTYSYRQSASDQRQYNSPLIDLPVVTVCRSKFGEYPQYHTSLDNLDYVSPEGLQGGYNFVKSCIEALEVNTKYKLTTHGAPQLGKRDLYPSLSTKGSFSDVESMVNMIDYADGNNDLIDISNLINQPVEKLNGIARELLANGLFEEVK